MGSKVKFGVAAALIFVAVATVPALVCLSYVTQNAHQHNCCPQERPSNPTVARCCVYSPAVTSASIDAPPPMIGAEAISAELTGIISSVEPAPIPVLDTSPPGCSSILRI